MSVPIHLIPAAEIARVRAAALSDHDRIALVAAMARANALAMVKRAGSGHLGSSFSAMDIVAWLYMKEMNTLSAGITNPDRDIYFSSKGHDVPGLYAMLYGAGVIPRERFIRLRRLGGLDGHPDIGVPGIEANSGSLGMGISKGRGMAWAQRQRKSHARVFVMIGDGELQEGQNFEAFQTTAQQRVGNLTVIVDHNKVQSDKLVSEIVDLGDLEAKLRAFGWFVVRADGHDLRAIEGAFGALRDVTDRPKMFIADTIKGRGVSFMEHPRALADGGGFYRWHAGAPPDSFFLEAYGELVEKIERELSRLGLGALVREEVLPDDPPKAVVGTLVGEPVSAGAQTRLSATAEFIADAYGQALTEMAKTHPELVVLDADLSADCRTRSFEAAFPDRFIENGIAEQDMVSMAGGLARQGLLPVVNSFASFLASRANEQIYNCATEGSKIIYACHYAGVIPAGPGKSHQSIRDISLLGALPNMVIFQPANAIEAGWSLRFAVEEARENVTLRINIGPSPRTIELPPDYQLRVGTGAVLERGGDRPDAVLVGYGPVMLHEALIASRVLAERGRALRVVNLPWLNRLDATWFRAQVPAGTPLFVVEDHSPVGGLGDALRRALVDDPIELRVFGVDGYPACGAPQEALRAHRLDGASLAERITERLR